MSMHVLKDWTVPWKVPKCQKITVKPALSKSKFQWTKHIQLLKFWQNGKLLIKPPKKHQKCSVSIFHLLYFKTAFFCNKGAILSEKHLFFKCQFTFIEAVVMLQSAACKQLYWSRCWRGSRSSSLALWLTRNATLVFGLFVDVPWTKLPVGPVVWCGWFNLPFRWQRNWQSDFWDRFERHKYNIGAIAAFEYAIATELIILFWMQKIEYESS